MAFYQRFERLVRDLISTGRDVLVVGDAYVNTGHLDFDVHDPTRLSKVSGFLQEERDWMNGFIQIKEMSNKRTLQICKLTTLNTVNWIMSVVILHLTLQLRVSIIILVALVPIYLSVYLAWLTHIDFFIPHSQMLLLFMTPKRQPEKVTKGGGLIFA